MSSSNGGRARKRLSLFAGGSLAVASILGGVALAPQAALAADECGVVSVSGNDCAGTQAGISYTTAANIALRMNNGVATTTSGVAVTATGAATVGVTRVDAPADSGDPSLVSTTGAGMQVTAATGAITVNLTDGDTADTPIVVRGTTRGVQLQTGSTTAAALTLTTTNGSITATGAGGIGVEATSTSVGAGNVQLTLGGAVSGATGVKGTSSGTGGLTVSLLAASATTGGDIVGTNGAAIQLTPGANVTVTVQAGRIVRATNPSGAVVELTNINATRNAIITLSGGTIRSNDEAVSGYDDLAVLVAGGAGNATVNDNNGGAINGRLSLLNTGNAIVNVRADSVWHTAGVTTIGQGASTGTLTMALDGVLGAAGDGVATTLDFGGGTDTFTNTGGVLHLGEGAEGAATLTITGLETWTNSGMLRFGVDPLSHEGTDGVANDRIALSGAATLFTGRTSSSGADFRKSRMIMDVDLGASQLDCSAAITADCLDLRGSSTAGETTVLINVVGGGPGASRVVLVDVAGAGTSAEEHFILDPNSPERRDIGDTGGLLDGGLFLYDFTYDVAAKQHILSPATPDGEGLQLSVFGQAADIAWRTTTGSWLTRQADLRNTLGGLGAGGHPGVWLKIVGNFVENPATQTYVFGPDTLDFDTGYSQKTSALVAGVDLVNVSGEGGAWVVGVTGGRVTSDLTFHELPTELDFEGSSLGGYVSVELGALFVDAIANAVKLDTEYSAASIGVAGLEGEVESVGYQVESGYRLAINDGAAHLEPLAALAWVRSDLSELRFGNVATQFDEAVSFRGALGVRLAGALANEAFTAQFSLTTRVWQEFEGANAATIATPYGDFALLDDTAGALGDVGVAIGLFAGEGFSANLGYSVKFNSDHYQSTDASLSLRFTW